MEPEDDDKQDSFVNISDLPDSYAANPGAILTWSGSDFTTSVQYGPTETQKRLDEIEKRLAIINPDEVLMEKYPALKEAYDHYKMIEAMVNQNKEG